MIEVRQARAEDIAGLRARLEQSGGEVVDLETARVWVALEGGIPVGMLAMRMTWQVEPLLIYPEVQNQMTRRRAGLQMYRAAAEWLEGAENRSGVRWVFGITRNTAVGRWLVKLGWLRQYKDAATFVKYVGGHHG